MKTNRRRLLQALSVLPLMGAIKPAIATIPIEEDVPPPEEKDVTYIDVSVNGSIIRIPAYHEPK